MSGSIFSLRLNDQIAQKIHAFLLAEPITLTRYTQRSTRAGGDAIEAALNANLAQVIGGIVKIQNYSTSLTRRSMEDIAFSDDNGNYYAIDVKSHNIDTTFNMPALVSVKRISDFYQQDNNHFVILKS